MDEPQIHVGYTRRFRTPDGQSGEVTINLSRIPPTAGQGLIEAMLGNARLALDAVVQEAEDRINPQRKVNPAAFAPASDSPRPDERRGEGAGGEGSESGMAVSAMGATGVPPVDPEPAPSSTRAIEVPPEAEIRTGSTALGIEIPSPPYDWLSEPITETPTADTSSTGQLVALNAGLTSIGYGKGLRHPAALALLSDYGPIYDHAPRHSIESLRDLSKAEAHIVLSWLDKAGMDHINALSEALGQRCLI